MRIKTCILVLGVFGSTLARAATPGHFRARNASVIVALAGDGYQVTIEVSGRSSCLFEDRMNEVDEGDLRYSGEGCRLRVLQADDGRSLSVHGNDACSRFCGAGAEIEIPRAVR